MLTNTAAPLTHADYELFRRLIHAHSGIDLGPQKQQLVQARLGKRLRAGDFKSYRAYYEYVRRDRSGVELSGLLDAIATNTTHLFREQQHFAFLAQTLRSLAHNRAWRATHRAVRIWSAGCSSGEEPYSIAMTVDDVLRPHPELDWKMLATDISTPMLARARAGVYEAHRLGPVPESFRRRYFVPAPEPHEGCLQIHPRLRSRIVFARLNLATGRFPFRHGFQFILCRNVMIYFDRPTRRALVARLAQHLRPGGFLLIGHSESLHPLTPPLKFVRPAVYQKVVE